MGIVKTETMASEARIAEHAQDGNFLGVPRKTLERLCMCARKDLGIACGRNLQDLARRLIAAAREAGIHDIDRFVDFLCSEKAKNQRLHYLVSLVTIGETYFFRNPSLLHVLEWSVFPSLFSRKAQQGVPVVRVWSAGCSTGEEAYTLAMILDQVSKTSKNNHASILATDVNHEALDVARRARYGPRSFRAPIPPRFASYFRPKGPDLFEISPQLKKMISFRPLNLIHPIYPSIETMTTALDVILCRNVLMYLEEDIRGEILERFSRCLVDDGWLVLGAAELHFASPTVWERVRFPGAILLRKRRNQNTRPSRTILPPQFSNPLASPLKENFQKACGDIHSTRHSKNSLDSSKPPFQRFSNPAKEKDLEIQTGKGPDEDLSEILSSVNALQSERRIPEALALLEKALEQRKLDPRLHFAKGTLCWETGDTEEAINAYRRVLSLDPSAVMAHLALGILYSSRKKDAKARSHLEKALRRLETLQDEDSLLYGEDLSAAQVRHMVRRLLEHDPLSQDGGEGGGRNRR